MEIANLMEEFRNWLESREIADVEIEENVGPDENITTITFPIDEGDEYVSYDIIASLGDEAPIFFCGDYCDVPDVDELELLRFVNDLNRISPLTLTVEDGSLCFSYSILPEFVTDAELLAQAFFYIWDAIDEIRDEIRDAFGLSPVIEDEDDGEGEGEEETPADEEE